MPEKRRTLAYRRACFLNPDAPHALQYYIAKAHTALSVVDARRVSLDTGWTLECRHFKQTTKACWLHLAAYTIGEKASIVPIKKGVAEADLSTAPPPDGTELMDGDVMMFVSGNHLLFCSNSLHESHLENYLLRIFDAAGLDAESRAFSIEKPANPHKVALLKEGIKSITLGATLYEVSLAEAKRTSTKSKLLGCLTDELRALIGKDKALADISADENIEATLILRFDSRKKGGELGQRRLTKLARDVSDEETEGFVIETRSENKIRHDDITLRKTIFAEAYGKSVDHNTVFLELEKYYGELSADGLLDN